MGSRVLGIVFVLAAVVSSVVLAADPVPQAKTLTKVVLNGKESTYSHACFVRAPDNWEEKQQNAVVLITPNPVDPKKLAAATTLAQAIDGLGPHVRLEIRADKHVDLSICDDGFGKGMCYSTSAYETDWKPIAFEAKRVAGEGLTSFMGEEETVFQKYKLFYDIVFDAAWVKDFAARR